MTDPNNPLNLPEFDLASYDFATQELNLDESEALGYKTPNGTIVHYDSYLED